MGVWGTGIYSNDTAEDVRAACQDIFAIYDIEEGNQKLFHYFKEVLDNDCIDDDYASFWYALADWQWKHGMLTKHVKDKAMSLLDSYIGLEQWLETGNKADEIKRVKVLDKLKKQLQTEPRAFKKPKLSLASPKHKPGDVIIFQATDFVDEYDSKWHITDISPAFIFASDNISKSKYENIDGYDAHGKYMAILCIGSIKAAHSEYVPEMFDEYSLYAWYNYLSESMPSINQLTTCGFLPFVKWDMKDYNRGITKSISWVYRFTLESDAFKSNVYINNIRTSKGILFEVDRFNLLYASKNYTEDYYSGDVLTSMFNVVFEESVRAKLLGVRIDDLLNLDIYNPVFLPPEEIDQAYIEYKKNVEV